MKNTKDIIEESAESSNDMSRTGRGKGALSKMHYNAVAATSPELVAEVVLGLSEEQHETYVMYL